LTKLWKTGFTSRNCWMGCVVFNSFESCHCVAHFSAKCHSSECLGTILIKGIHSTCLSFLCWVYLSRWGE